VSVTIVNRMRRRVGLPKRRLLIINAPKECSAQDRTLLAETCSKNIRNVTVLVLPYGFVSQVVL
jgi:hypothetical protein